MTCDETRCRPGAVLDRLRRDVSAALADERADRQAALKRAETELGIICAGLPADAVVLTAAENARLRAAIAEAVMVLADLDAARSRLALMRAEYAALLAAARAAVAAAQAGDADPLGYVRGVLEGRGQLPAAGARPAWIVADARSAMALTGAGWPS